MPSSCRFLVYGSDTGKLPIGGQPWCKNGDQHGTSLDKGTEGSQVEQSEASKEDAVKRPARYLFR